MGPLLNRVGWLVTQDLEKSQVLNMLFISVFTSKADLQKLMDPEREKVPLKENSVLLLLEEIWVRAYLGKLGKNKSMGPGGKHSLMRRELPDVSVRPPSIIFEKSE